MLMLMLIRFCVWFYSWTWKSTNVTHPWYPVIYITHLFFSRRLKHKRVVQTLTTTNAYLPTSERLKRALMTALFFECWAGILEAASNKSLSELRTSLRPSRLIASETERRKCQIRGSLLWLRRYVLTHAGHVKMTTMSRRFTTRNGLFILPATSDVYMAVLSYTLSFLITTVFNWTCPS